MLLEDIVRSLLDAIDPDNVEAKAFELASLPSIADSDKVIHRRAQDALVGEAASVFNGELINLLDGIRREKEQTIDHEGLDTVLHSGWAGDSEENARQMAQDFREYLDANRDQVEALTIFYSQPHRRSELTYAMIREVLDKLKEDKPLLAPLRVWRAYVLLDEYKGNDPATELTALVALIRRVCGIDETLSTYSETVRKNFQSWIMKRHSGGDVKIRRRTDGLATDDP